MVVRSLDGLLAPMSFMLRSTTEKGLFIPEGIENQVLLAERGVREHYFPNRSRNFPDWILIFAILKIIEAQPNATVEDIFQMMTTPALLESSDLRREIHAAIAACRSHRAEHGWNEPSVFNGAKNTELEKLGAMTAYFGARGSKVCRQKLNMLLFYADFAHYYLHEVSISGAKYVRVCQGPLQEFYDRVFDSMVANGIVGLDISEGEEQVVKLSDSILDRLTIAEMRTLQWVLSTFGKFSCLDISEHARRESAHRFTRRGDYIAYEYARLFKNLPQPSLT